MRTRPLASPSLSLIEGSPLIVVPQQSTFISYWSIVGKKEVIRS
jgi:hypothetical protein